MASQAFMRMWPKGRHVVATEHYRRNFPGAPTTGKIVGYGKTHDFIVVARDGISTHSTYAPVHWRLRSGVRA